MEIKSKHVLFGFIVLCIIVLSVVIMVVYFTNTENTTTNDDTNNNNNIITESTTNQITANNKLFLILDKFRINSKDNKKKSPELPESSWDVIQSTSYKAARLGIEKIAKQSLLGDEMTQVIDLSSQTQTPISIPIYWDQYEGAYMITFGLGANQSLSFVIDSGSSHLTAKGESCKWVNCTDNSQCNIQACPCKSGNGANCDHYTYIPVGPELSNKSDLGLHKILSYGSQEAHVNHYLDLIKLSTGELLGPAIVNKMNKITGTSSSNIFGTSQPTKQKNTLLDNIYKTKPPVWTMETHNFSGTLYFGYYPDINFRQQMFFVPLIQPYAFTSFVTKFYVLPISDIQVKLLDWSEFKSVNSKYKIQYALIDTGTTLTYTSYKFGDALKQLGISNPDEPKYELRILFSDIEDDSGKSTQEQWLSWSSQQLIDTDDSQSNIICSTKQSTFDDFDSLFSNEHVMMIGMLQLNNMIIEHDCIAERIGFYKF